MKRNNTEVIKLATTLEFCGWILTTLGNSE